MIYSSKIYTGSLLLGSLLLGLSALAPLVTANAENILPRDKSTLRDEMPRPTDIPPPPSITPTPLALPAPPAPPLPAKCEDANRDDGGDPKRLPKLDGSVSCNPYGPSNPGDTKTCTRKASETDDYIKTFCSGSTTAKDGTVNTWTCEYEMPKNKNPDEVNPCCDLVLKECKANLTGGPNIEQSCTKEYDDKGRLIRKVCGKLGYSTECVYIYEENNKIRESCYTKDLKNTVVMECQADIVKENGHSTVTESCLDVATGRVCRTEFKDDVPGNPVCTQTDESEAG